MSEWAGVSFQSAQQPQPHVAYHHVQGVCEGNDAYSFNIDPFHDAGGHQYAAVTLGRRTSTVRQLRRRRAEKRWKATVWCMRCIIGTMSARCNFYFEYRGATAVKPDDKGGKCLPHHRSITHESSGNRTPSVKRAGRQNSHFSLLRNGRIIGSRKSKMVGSGWIPH